MINAPLTHASLTFEIPSGANVITGIIISQGNIRISTASKHLSQGADIDLNITFNKPYSCSIMNCASRSHVWKFPQDARALHVRADYKTSLNKLGPKTYFLKRD